MGRTLSLFVALFVILWGRSILLSETAAPAVALRDGLLVTVIGMAIFALNSRLRADPLPTGKESGLRGLLPLPVWIGLAVAGAGGVWLALGIATARASLLLPFLLWAIGLLLSLGWLFWPRKAASRSAQPPVWSVESARLFLERRRTAAAPAPDGPLALSRRTIYLSLGILTLAALLLRLWNPGGLPDGCLPAECRALTTAFALLETDTLSGALASDSPGYYLLLSTFLALFGVSGTVTRAIGLLLAAGTIPLFFAALRRFVPPLPGLLSILFIVFSPIHIALSRHPAPALLLFVLILAWLGARPRPVSADPFPSGPASAPANSRRWVLAGVLGGLALLTASPFTAWLLLIWMALVPPVGRGERVAYYAGLLVAGLPALARGFGLDNFAVASVDAYFREAAGMAAQMLVDGGYLPGLLSMAGGAALLRHLHLRQGWLWSSGFFVVGLTVFTTREPIGFHGIAPLLVLISVGIGVAVDQLAGALIREWAQVIRPARLAAGVGALLALVLLVGGLSRLNGLADELGGGESGRDAAIGAYVRATFAQAGETDPAETGGELALIPADVLESPSFLLAARGVLPDPRVAPLDPLAHLPFVGPPFVAEGMADLLYIVPDGDADLRAALVALYPGQFSEPIEDDSGRVWGGAYRVPRATAAGSQGLPGLYFSGEDTFEGEIDPLREALQAHREGPLDFAWQTSSPIPPPFTLRGAGALYIPEAGTYSFRIVAGSGPRARLTIETSLAETVKLDTDAGLLESTVGLPRGFFPLQIAAYSGERGGPVAFEWRRPNSEWETIPRQALYGPEAAGQTGLLARYYAPPEDGPLVLDPEGLAAAPLVDWRVEPWLPRRPQVIPGGAVQWQGKVAAPVEGAYGFFVTADGPHRLEIDGITLINSGASETSETSLLLSQGWHDLTLIYQPGAEGLLEMLWQPPQSSILSRLPAAFLTPRPAGVAADDLALPRLAEASQRPGPSLGEPQSHPEIATGPPAPVGSVAVDDLPDLPFALAWQVGSCGSDIEQFLQPRGVTINRLSGLVYVADQGSRRVVLRDLSDGGLVDFYTDENFEEPFDLDVDLLGRVYLLDAVAQAIYRFEEPEGVAVAQPSATAFYRPRGLGMDLNGNFYVADTGGARVVKLNGLDGAVEMQEGGPDTGLGGGQPVDVLALPSGAIYAVTAEDGVLWRLDTRESWQVLRPANTFDSPHLTGLTTGSFFVSNPESRQILFFNGQGRPLGRLNSEIFQKPVGVAALILETDVLLAVADSASCQLSLWRAPLDALTTEQ